MHDDVAKAIAGEGSSHSLHLQPWVQAATEAVMPFIKQARLDERERVLAIIQNTPRAALIDGRDLVVRTDIIRKVQH